MTELEVEAKNVRPLILELADREVYLIPKIGGR
jgi:hypothetical protein